LEEKIKSDLDLYDKKVILYVGRLKQRKGVQFLIRAFDKLATDLDEVILLIVGKGDYGTQLKLISDSLNSNNNIYFLGYVEDKLLPAYYNLCNLLVVPSITYLSADPCPLTVNEAMYFGKPIIATDAVGSAFDMISDGINGLIVKEGDIESLYLGMKKILLDSELERKMGVESKNIIESKYSYQNMLDALINAANFAQKNSRN
jgi:glycosyltransferase involved in cell wall biosynthesis